MPTPTPTVEPGSCPGSDREPQGKGSSNSGDHTCLDGKGRQHGGNGNNDDNNGDRDKTKGGIVVVLPLSILLAGTTFRRQVARSLRRHRIAR